MDLTAIIAKWVLGLVFIVGGLGYAFVRYLADASGDPDQGSLGGFGPILTGAGVAVIGVLIIVF